MTHPGAHSPDLRTLVKRNRIELGTYTCAGGAAIHDDGAPAGIIQGVLRSRQIELVEVRSNFELLERDKIKACAVVFHVLPTELVDHAVVTVITWVELVECGPRSILGGGIAGGIIVLGAQTRFGGGVTYLPSHDYTCGA